MKIVIGQYYPTESILHNLDARTKLCATVLFIVTLVMVNSWIAYGVAFFALSTVIAMSKVPPVFMLRGLRAMMFILAFSAALNIFLIPGENILLEFWIISISAEGVSQGVRIAIRLILLIVGSTVMTLTTTPIQLADAIESILQPFKKIGMPVHEIAMMMTIALRFIPTLMEEVDKIMKAQMARGADFDTGGLIKKAKSLVPLLVPLFVSAFRRADELAQAMDARCYRGDVNRTKMKIMKYSVSDFWAAIAVVVYAVTLIFVDRLGIL
ncbi:MAG: energy-coupling factor transporter transmembrane protein EcfT [Defluviitaleaceae bacterium]|nr:energy-coupling factor transporter transmembrane protein EcfT [Defluviitaleaceae bacterium]